MSKKVKLLSICKPKQYKTISKNELVEDGKYLVYGANGVIGKSNKYTHENPTLMVTCRGATCGSLNISKPFSYINGNAMVFDSIDKNFDLMYLYYYLSSRGFNDAISGTAQPQITRENLKNIDVLELSLEKQKQIAKTLDKANELINLRKESITKLDALAKSIFIDMFGDPVLNTKDYELTTLGKLVHWVKDGPHESPIYSETGIPFLSTRHVGKGKIIWKDLKYIDINLANTYWKRCKPEWGDILYSKGGTTGIACAVKEVKEFAIWVHIALLKTNHEKTNFIWLENMLNTDFCYSQSQHLTRGIANKDLGLKRMINIKLYYPPIDLQNKFAEIVEKIEEQKSLYEKELEKLEENFQALLQKSFQE